MPRDTYQPPTLPPRTSWWAEPQAQRDYAAFDARLAAELPRLTNSREGQRLLNSTFIVGPPERV